MTRINCGMPPAKLIDQHLIAEYRELPRVFKLARPINNIPDSFRMGAGHVLFFYDKLPYLYNRFQQICSEMKLRGFLTSESYNDYVKKLFTAKCRSISSQQWMYNPEQKEFRISRLRIQRVIKERIVAPRYYRVNISKRKAIKLLGK